MLNHGMLNHGGKLMEAASRYSIPVSDWLDLSTGVNPKCYPIPDIPVSAWNRLPEDEDGLKEVAAQYYQCSSILPVAGSQAAIQTLPIIRRQLFPDSKTALIPKVGYKEHDYAWKQQGYEILTYQDEPSEHQLALTDVLVVINPNNPTGHLVSSNTLLQWHSQLAKKGSWLVVDEAFMDSHPEYSVSTNATASNLIVLRSVGKFYGLAGIRMGFVLACGNILTAMKEQLGPWTVSGPSREICKAALLDVKWQESNRDYVLQSGKKLNQLLNSFFSEVSSIPLFTTIKTANAITIHQELCQQGIFTRLLDEKNGLRFGLPQSEHDFERLKQALITLTMPLPQAYKLPLTQ